MMIVGTAAGLEDVLQDTITVCISARRPWIRLYEQGHSLVMEGRTLVGASQTIFAAPRGQRALHRTVSVWPPSRDLCMVTHLCIPTCHPLAKTARGEKG